MDGGKASKVRLSPHFSKANFDPLLSFSLYLTLGEIVATVSASFSEVGG